MCIRPVDMILRETDKTLMNWQKQLETPSPCRPYPPSLSASQLAAQGSPTSQATKIGSPSQQRKAELFSRFDVRETSFHVYTGRIDLHLCDDASPGRPHLVTHLVCLTSRKTHRGGLGLVHEEAHPCFPYLVQPSFKGIDACQFIRWLEKERVYWELLSMRGTHVVGWHCIWFVNVSKYFVGIL